MVIWIVSIYDKSKETRVFSSKEGCWDYVGEIFREVVTTNDINGFIENKYVFEALIEKSPEKAFDFFWECLLRTSVWCRKAVYVHETMLWP